MQRDRSRLDYSCHHQGVPELDYIDDARFDVLSFTIRLPICNCAYTQRADIYYLEDCEDLRRSVKDLQGHEKMKDPGDASGNS